MRNSNAELAVQTCLEGIKQYPDDASILCLAGQSLIALKRFDAARGHINKAMSLHPDFSVAHEVFADLMLVEGQFEMTVK